MIYYLESIKRNDGNKNYTEIFKYYQQSICGQRKFILLLSSFYVIYIGHCQLSSPYLKKPKILKLVHFFECHAGKKVQNWQLQVEIKKYLIFNWYLYQSEF